MEGELVKNVYCDFTKLPSDAGTIEEKTCFPKFPEFDWIRRSQTYQTHIFQFLFCIIVWGKGRK
jgi:hypothetical protein